MSGQSHPSALMQPLSCLSREADHRIANSLAFISSLVRLHASHPRPAEDPRRFLIEIADRIQSVAQLHRLISHSGNGLVPLGAYLQEILERLSAALASGQTSFALDCAPECMVPPRVASSLGLIIAELYSNSLKYAHPSGLPVKVTVSCGPFDDHGLRIIYQDDGVGFPDGFDASRDGDLGMQFIRTLSDQLGGTHEWLSDALGVRFALSLRLID